VTAHRGWRPFARGGDGGAVSGYRLLGDIGSGGFSTVHLAEDLTAGRRVALKVARSRDVEVRERFAVEARVGALLASARGIVAALGVTRTRDGRPVLVLPYYDLGSAGSLLAEGDRLPLPAVVALVRQVAQGLDAMHGMHFLHRDVSPRNILRSSELGTGLCDLGCARAVNSVEQSPRTEALTPGYSAPEATLDGEVQTVASDVYGLAATTWALLTGEPPYGPPPDPRALDLVARYELRRCQSRPPADRLLAGGIPRAVVDVLGSALDPDPSQRPALVRTFGDALGAAAATGVSPSGPAARMPTDRPALLTGQAAPITPVGPLRPPGAGVAVVGSTEVAESDAGTGRAAGRGRAGPGQGRRSSRRRWVPVVVVVTCFLAAYGIVWLVSGSGQHPAAPSSTPSRTATAPAAATAAAPRDLHIVGRGGGQVTLAWTPPVSPNAVTVLDQSAGGAGWKAVEARLGGRAVVTLENPVGRYCFRLRVVVGAGPGSAPGNEVCTG
jgi:eukaryotic-like serine/threonine-protein kinase